MPLNRKYSRQDRGSFLADAASTAWILFLLLTFPLLDLASITLRYTFFQAASRDAAHAASRAKTFLQDTSVSEKSAVNIAQQRAAQTASSFSEVTVNSVTTNIVITNITSKTVSRQSVPLAQPANTVDNIYQIETVLTGQVNPLLRYNTGLLPNIPGLSAPVPVTVATREFCEYPQGLTQ